MEEYLQISDVSRQRKDSIVRRGKDRPGDGEYYNIIHVAIINSENRMLIQKRADDKSTWPGLWTVTCAGHVDRGETSMECAEREVKEELGIDIDLEGTAPSVTICYKPMFDDFYVVRMDVDPEDITLQKEEVSDVRWATEDEIFHMIDEGTFKPFYKGFIDTLFYFRDHSWATMQDLTDVERRELNERFSERLK